MFCDRGEDENEKFEIVKVKKIERFSGIWFNCGTQGHIAIDCKIMTKKKVSWRCAKMFSSGVKVQAKKFSDQTVADEKKRWYP